MQILLALLTLGAFADVEKEIVQILKPEKVHEECMELESPKKLKYTFTSNRDVLFNLHYHEGEKVTYPVAEKPRRIHKGVFQPSLKQTYCLMWTNKGKDDAEIKYKFSVN